MARGEDGETFHSCSMDASMHNLCCMKQTTCYIPRNPGWWMVILWDSHDGFLLIPTYLGSIEKRPSKGTIWKESGIILLCTPRLNSLGLKVPG